MFSIIIKSLITITTIILVSLIVLYHALEVQVRISKFETEIFNLTKILKTKFKFSCL
jgi:hypothetical protein